MDFGLYEKHETFIKERWLAIRIDVTLAKEPEKKISIIRKAQKQAVKEIHDLEVKSTFIEYLERELIWLIASSKLSIAASLLKIS